MYQMMDQDFVGIIISCFNEDPSSVSSHAAILCCTFIINSPLNHSILLKDFTLNMLRCIRIVVILIEATVWIMINVFIIDHFSYVLYMF